MLKFIIILIALIAIKPGELYAEVKDLPRITVMADASIYQPLNKLARDFSTRNNIIVSVIYGAPQNLLQSIVNGSSADLFISEDLNAIQNMKTQGLIDVYSQSNIAKNHLVMIARLDYVEGGSDMMTYVVNPASSPIGIYSRGLIEKLALPTENIVEVNSEHEAIDKAVQNKGYAIVYNTTAVSLSNVKIINVFNDDMTEEIVYQAAVVAGDQMNNAREFLKYLKTPAAIRVFDKAGYNGGI